MTDFNEISEVLIKKGKVRGKPVAISLFRDTDPEEYEPIQDTPCSIVRFAMDDGKKTYFDAEHHDCLVGVHHAGITPGKSEIVTGEYLSKTSSFFTYEGAARIKSGTPNLPAGMVKAIGAAPLDAVPKGIAVDWIVVVCNPHNANPIAGCRAVRDGVLPHAVFGTSLCGDLFSLPWHEKNIVVTPGDFGGRMHNRIKQDQLFVIIPAEFADCLPDILLNVKVDVKVSRQMTKPPFSDFWNKKEKKAEDAVKAEESKETPELVFTMAWDDEARELIKKTPEGIQEMAVENSETYAKEHGYEMVTRQSMKEQMKGLGMDLDEMLEG